MADKSVLTLKASHNENALLSKESTIINNNLMSFRTFGRDISNIGTNEPNKPSSVYMSKNDSQGIVLPDFNFVNEARHFNFAKQDPFDLSLAELPKTTKDPLLASRELLSFKFNPEKDRINPQSRVAPQRIPLRLFEMENCDLFNVNNPQYVSIYAKEIFEHLLNVEDNFCPRYGALTQIQPEINDKMRAILLDWLVDIHLKFKLLPETLYLAINLVDRMLEKISTTKKKFQLLGVTSMLIAAKYQEIYPPEIKEFIRVTDNAYTKEEILDMEGKILCELNFKLTIPSAFSFLDRYTKLVEMDERAIHLCQFFIETALMDYRMVKYRPSLLVCAAIHLANKALKRSVGEEVLVNATNHSEQNIKLCAKDLFIALRNADKLTLKAVKRKFLTTQYMEVAKIPLEMLFNGI